jgi:hypothetical protein
MVAASIRANIRSAASELDLGVGQVALDLDDDPAAALAGDPLVGVVEPAQQSDGVDRALGELEPLGLDPGGGVEIVDRRQEPPRLVHDVGGPRAIAKSPRGPYTGRRSSRRSR